MSRIAVLVALLLALLVPAPVRAAFHIAVIDEVMSGVMPEAARKVAASGLAMIQRAPAAPFGTHGCVAAAPPRLLMSTWKPPPSA